MTYSEDFPETFVEQVKEALEKLYDFHALQENSLIQKFSSQTTDTLTTGTHQLRSQMIAAIETLNPGQDVAADSGTARIYHLVYMHYVGKMTVQQAAWEVGVSLRQAYRDLRRGEELVSAVLWQKFNAATSTIAQSSSVKDELIRLGDSTSVTVLQEMLERAVRAIQLLAEKYEVIIKTQVPADEIMLTTNPIIAQQILTHILSQIIQQVSPAHIDIELFSGNTFIQIDYPVKAPPEIVIKPIIEQLMAKISWELHYHFEDHMHQLFLQASQKSALVVLIDDNEGLIDLVQRYFTEDAYQVMSVPNTEQGLQIVQQLQPDVIILDLMMPGMDGWELLQRLRTNSKTAAIPVIICSVINDPELAFSLGASRYVPKPVTRESLLLALQELHI